VEKAFVLLRDGGFVNFHSEVGVIAMFLGVFEKKPG
jgi:hypothetical protein